MSGENRELGVYRNPDGSVTAVTEAGVDYPFDRALYSREFYSQEVGTQRTIFTALLLASGFLLLDGVRRVFKGQLRSAVELSAGLKVLDYTNRYIDTMAGNQTLLDGARYLEKEDETEESIVGSTLRPVKLSAYQARVWEDSI